MVMVDKKVIFYIEGKVLIELLIMDGLFGL